MPIADYIVVKSASIDMFATMVSVYIADKGYELQGGVAIAALTDNTIVYSQALIKRES
jgi:hypothetical protein